MPGNEILKLFEQEATEEPEPKRNQARLNFRKRVTSGEDNADAPGRLEQLQRARSRIQEAFRARRR